MNLSKMRDVFGVEYKEIVNKTLPKLYIEELLNRGARSIATRTRCLDSIYTTNSVVDQGTYGLTSEIQYGGIFMVEYDGEELIYQNSPTSDTSSGTPSSYYLLEGTLGLWPIPTAAKEIKIYGYEIPPDMTADGDISTIPVEYHELMVDFALSKAFRRVDPEESKARKFDFEQGLLEMQGKSSRQVHQSGYIKNLTSEIFQ